MKNMYARIPIILLIALIIGFTSCSDDKDEIVMTWTQINTNLQDEVRYLQFLSDDVGYAKVISFSGWGFKLTKTINGGSIWSDITFPLNQSEYAVVDFSFQNADTGYVILNSDPNHIQRTFDGGESWDSVYVDVGWAYQLLATNAGKVYFIVSTESGRKLYKTEDYFQSWIHIYNFPEGVVGEFKYLSKDDAAFFVFNNWEGNESYIFRIYNDIVDQIYIPKPDPINSSNIFVTALYFLDKDSGFFVINESNNDGYSVAICKTVDFELGYETMATVPHGSAGGNGLYFMNATAGWVGTGNGQIYRVVGSEFTLEFQNIYDNGISCFSHANGGSNLYFGGTGGTMGKYLFTSDVY